MSSFGATPLCGWPEWPDYGLTDDLLPTLARWVGEKRRFALATLVQITGSSPRPLGSEMAISDSGEIVGYVSGGCVESAVAAEALASLSDGRPRFLDYGAGSPVLDVQLACGGRIGILVREPVDPLAYVELLSQARRQRRTVSVHTSWNLGMSESGVPIQGRFEKLHAPPIRLIAVGADPITVALARMAGELGFEVGLIRPLGPERAPASCNLVFYDRRSISVAMEHLQIDRWCAIYTLTHDADTDLQVLKTALKSPAFCVGALGSRRKIAIRQQRLIDEGISQDDVAKLHAPAGLPISGHTPKEIALSILGEIVVERAASRSDGDVTAEISIGMRFHEPTGIAPHKWVDHRSPRQSNALSSAATQRASGQVAALP